MFELICDCSVLNVGCEVIDRMYLFPVLLKFTVLEIQNFEKLYKNIWDKFSEEIDMQ